MTQQSERDRSLSRKELGAGRCCEIEALTRCLRRPARPHRCFAARRGRAVRRHRRAERRRQDHAVQGRSPARSLPSSRAASCIEGHRSARGAAGAARAPRHRACARRAPGVHALTVLENLEMGAYTAGAREHWARNLERILTLFPGAGRPPTPTRRHALRRRAADAGHRPRLASSPRLLHARRAVDGAAPTVADLIFERIEAHPPTRTASPSCWSSSGWSKRWIRATPVRARNRARGAGRAARDALLADDRVRNALISECDETSNRTEEKPC